MATQSKMLRTREVAEQLRVSTRTVQHWVLTGVLPAVRVSKGGIWLVREEDLEATLITNNVADRKGQRQRER